MERGAIIDAQITLDEEIWKEIERCKNPIYVYENYWRIQLENGEYVNPTKAMVEFQRHVINSINK